ncbi:hypothetical protein [Janthinobacterium psychrotolerans]|uniref:Uncharacterized protein n=1 Tax=Janthinobacterium psychrotolerans TaxID=1747903 RepID=A0A1A7C2A8_9BURK|nr:hypothetical protein [Janthinobacterium psychrotolerans]OBV38448.1 hypothetical protein ASR47_100644 [Janthinobacterium psychrotolerans]
MAFFLRDYQVFLLLAAPDAPGLWTEDEWTLFAGEVDPIVAQARGKGAVRSIQYNAAGKPIAFGRIGWDARGHAKWTHTPAGTDARFMSVEAWAPAWSTCEKDDQAPDLFISLINEEQLNSAGKPLLFGQRMVVAIATDMEPEAAATVRAAMARLAARQRAAVFAHVSRRWGKWQPGGFSSAIQDLLLTDLFKPGNPHERALDAATFKGRWEMLAPAV